MEEYKESSLLVEISAEVHESLDQNGKGLLSGVGTEKLAEVLNQNGAQYESCEQTDQEREESGRKRKKPRRGKPRKKQWVRSKDDITSPTLQKRRRSNVFVHGQPAPNNTTQFIMEDHTDIRDLDAQLTAQGNATIGPGSSLHKTSRARDSSFSVDSDEEFYSSPEDEEEFLTKEFSNTYEDVHVERLGTMTKSELIQEYLQLEERVDFLEKKLQNTQNLKSDQNGGAGTDSEGELNTGELSIEPAMAEKIRIFQEEITKLTVENQQLSRENDRLRTSGTINRSHSSLSSSSVDSESDSSTSTGSSSSSTSNGSKVTQSQGSPSSRSMKSIHSSHSNSSIETATGQNILDGSETVKVLPDDEVVLLSDESAKESPQEDTLLVNPETGSITEDSGLGSSLTVASH